MPLRLRCYFSVIPPSFRHFCSLTFSRGRSFSSPTLYSAQSSSPLSKSFDKSFLGNYLLQSLRLPVPGTRRIFARFAPSKITQHPELVVGFFRDLGFSDTEIRASVSACPQILFAVVDTDLKPKVQFFQELGLTGSGLAKFISENSTYLLNHVFDERLKPCVDVIQKVIRYDPGNENLIRVLRRHNWGILKDPLSRLMANIEYLEGCGIVGSQLALLMIRQPRVFMFNPRNLRRLMSEIVDMGFSLNSRMLVHGLYTINGLSRKTFKSKIDLFKSFGFTEVECIEMFRRAPALLRASEAKLKLGLKVFLGLANFDKSLLIRRPTSLMHSMEERVIPRYRVLQIIRSQRLMKNDPKFLRVLTISEDEFVKKYIIPFRDHVAELLAAYRDRNFDSLDE